MVLQTELGAATAFHLGIIFRQDEVSFVSKSN